MIMSRLILPGWRNFSGESYRENKESTFYLKLIVSENHVIYRTVTLSKSETDRSYVIERHVALRGFSLHAG
jgi:hypothetical protein